jgi:hypothetical protein
MFPTFPAILGIGWEAGELSGGGLVRVPDGTRHIDPG